VSFCTTRPPRWRVRLEPSDGPSTPATLCRAIDSDPTLTSGRGQRPGSEPSPDRLGVTPMAVALAWLLQRSQNILLISGTSSVEHLRENLAANVLELPADGLAELDAIGR
jgi:Aldo/keto reductase family